MKFISTKKTLALLLAIMFMFAISGCGEKQVTSEYWVYEEVDVEDGNEKKDSSDKTTVKNEDGNQSSGKDSNQKDESSDKGLNPNINILNVGTKGANGKDYSNYDPYKGIEKYKGKTLKFASWINHANDEFSTAIDSFYKKYGIKVESVFCVQANYLEQVTALIAAGKAPDIVVENAFFPSVLQIAQPFSNSGLDINEPFWDQDAIKGMNPKGKVYYVNSVNSYVQPFGVVVYQRDIMEANGIKTPSEYYKEGEWTLDNLIKCANEFAALGDDYYGCNLEGLHLRGIFGGQMVKFDGDKLINNLTSNACIEAGKFELKVLNNTKLSGTTESFVKGKTGITIRDSFVLKRTGYLAGVDGDSLGFTYLPKADGKSEEVVTGFLRGYAIAKGSKNAVPAGMFIRYMLDSDNIDLSGKSFFNKEAAQFFYDAVAKNQKLKKNYDYGYGVAATDGVHYSTYKDGATDPTQIATVYESHKNQLQNAVDDANKIFNSAK